MNKTSHLLTLAAALLLAPLTATFAQSTWETVDDFQYAPGKAAGNSGIAASTDGTLFVAGSGTDAAGVKHGVVHRSLDGGATWDTVLDVPSVGLTRLATSPTGLVLAVGSQSGSNGISKWVTCRSNDGGVTWSLADQFQFSGGASAIPWGVAADASRIYVSGNARDAKSVFHWVVRRSTDGGLTWTTVDDVPVGGSTSGCGITVTPSGSVIAVGQVAGKWTVRRSINGGNTWATVDSYRLDSRYVASARGVAADGNGHLYVTGFSAPHWITRKSTDGGSTWLTVDDFMVNGSGNGIGGVAVDAFGRIFAAGTGGIPQRWIVRGSTDAGANWVTTDDYQLSPTKAAMAQAVCGDASGNVFVVGGAFDAAGVNHAVVRKLAAP